MGFIRRLIRCMRRMGRMDAAKPAVGKGLWVDLDPRDNSVTLSEGLYDDMCLDGDGEWKVFVFGLKDKGLYGFRVLDMRSAEASAFEGSPLADVQYNGKTRTIGFESLCPTVNRIFYDYGLGVDHAARLSTVPCRSVDGWKYYIIGRPYGEVVG